MIHPGLRRLHRLRARASRRSTEQVTVSAINRNYQNRSGPGQLYLASPLTVAASAVAGRIVAYREGMFAPRTGAGRRRCLSRYGSQRGEPMSKPAPAVTSARRFAPVGVDDHDLAAAVRRRSPSKTMPRGPSRARRGRPAPDTIGVSAGAVGARRS